ncbi:MAG: 2-oxo acid dehydrogenase subunit E2 [Patulibacter sp.]|nr:2-oxo acid dehydrogenase subunit E2 [Patulibacter sp.]
MSSLPTETATTVVDVLMPKMGSSVFEGTVVEWQITVGDAVEADQALCVISTDKVDSECPSPAAGVLAEIVVEEGETVEVGTVIGRVAVSVDAAGGTASSSVPPGDANRRAPAGPAPTRREILRRSSPVAAKIAAEHAIDVMRLTGSGRNGRVTKADVLDAVERQDSAPTSAGSVVEAPGEPPMHIESPYRRDPSVPVAGQIGAGSAPIPTSSPSVSSSRRLSTQSRQAAPATADGGAVVPLSRMRTAIGTQMRKALDTAAHATTIVECDMSRIERERRELGVTALPLVARHVLDALCEFPALNATYDGQTLTRFDPVHLGIAVSLGEDGLIVPVIHDAQELAPSGLASRIKDVAGRARRGELSPDEVRGGTFTITNPGAAGALIATPILNVPQVAILDLEAIVKRPVVVTDADGQDSIAIRPMTHLCMSWDHRVLDGMYAARFLTALRGRIEGR